MGSASVMAWHAALRLRLQTQVKGATKATSDVVMLGTAANVTSEPLASRAAVAARGAISSSAFPKAPPVAPAGSASAPSDPNPSRLLLL